MPRRPREHQLETESRLAFEAALGARWLFRALPEDYGIDGEVEEFDDAGNATGLIYSVQLKATDQKKLSKALKLPVPNDHADYYRSLQRPVLMVRYVADGKRVYARWFHQYDRYFDGGGAKSVTFRWREEDAWTDSRADELGEEARAYRRFTSTRTPFPITLHVLIDLDGVDRRKLSAALQSAAVQDVVLFSYSEPPAGANLVRITSSEVSIDLARVTKSFLHFDGDESPADIPPEQLASDVLVLLAMALERVGQSLPAGRLVEAFPCSSLGTNADAAASLAGEMTRSRQIYPALRVYEQLDQMEDEARSSALAFFLAVARHGPTLSEDETDALRGAIQRSVERRRESDPAGVAADMFNLANMERARGEHERALALLKEARDANPRYGKRLQWWAQMALITFAQGEYVIAANHFREALRHGESTLIQLQLAEALMEAGQYREALTSIPRLSDLDPEDPWVAQLVVVACVLETIVEHIGIDSHHRDASALAELEETMGELHSKGELIDAERLVEFLQRDALLYLPWLLLDADDTPGADELKLDAALMRAWLEATSAERWLDVIVHVLNDGPFELIPALFICGDEMTDEQLLPIVSDGLQTSEGAESESAQMIRLLVAAAEQSVLEARQRRDAKIDVRHVASNKTFHLPNSLATPAP